MSRSRAPGGPSSRASSGEVTSGRIAVCLDGSEVGECILPHALAIGRAVGAPLTLLRVLEGGTPEAAPPDPVGWEIQRREARHYLQRAAARGGGGDAIDTEVIEGQAAEEICHWGRHHAVGLTALCSHGVSGKTEWSLASTARKLVEGAPGSFLVVPAAAVAGEPVARYRRLLVPLDGSARAESVLPLARRIADAQDAELVLAHVVPMPELTEVGPFDAEDLDLRERLERRNERVANEYLDRLRAQLSESEAAVRALVLRGGDARSRLARLIAEEGVDLVVLSAHGRTARADLSLGSVTAYLLAHSAVPLLIVRPPSAAAVHRMAPAEGEEARLPSQATT